MAGAAHARDEGVLTLENFNKIKAYILQHGDRKTYCNMLNNNPHFQFPGFDAYLHPEGGQKNINCDPRLSDFNQLVFYNRNRDTEELYFQVVVKPDKTGLLPVKHQKQIIKYIKLILADIDR
jgi:hypothetical protein